MVIFYRNVTYAACLTARNIVFEVAIECLVLAVINFEVSKIASAMLSC